MTLTSAQQLRLYVRDQPVMRDRVYIGDGTGSAFLLPDSNLTSASAFVPITAPTTGWSATAATFVASGQVQFSGVISANSAFRVTYVTSNFSDAEIDYYLEDSSSLTEARIEVITTLMFDSLKRSRWAAPDGTSFDDTAAMAQLDKMYDQQNTELEKEAVVQGGLTSWSSNQQGGNGGWGGW